MCHLEVVKKSQPSPQKVLHLTFNPSQNAHTCAHCSNKKIKKKRRKKAQHGRRCTTETDMETVDKYKKAKHLSPRIEKRKKSAVERSSIVDRRDTEFHSTPPRTFLLLACAVPWQECKGSSLVPFYTLCKAGHITRLLFEKNSIEAIFRQG
jgi:hypothetical protein